MYSRILWVLCVSLSGGVQGVAGANLYLTGWAEFGGVSRAVITQLPENQSWIVRSDYDVGGYRLQLLDVGHGRAYVKHGDTIIDFSLVSSVSTIDPLVSFLRKGELPPEYVGPWPAGYEPAFIRLHREGQPEMAGSGLTGYGHPASGHYVGALRAYARSLPESARASVERELAHYSAGTLESNGSAGSPEPGITELLGSHALPVTPGSPPVMDANADYMKRLFASEIPEIGSLIGGGRDSELPRLRRLLREVDDPAVQLRLNQQLDGYNAPPIAPYVRNERGEWTDSGAQVPGI
jgi:hypothetical protein